MEKISVNQDFLSTTGIQPFSLSSQTRDQKK